MLHSLCSVFCFVFPQHEGEILWIYKHLLFVNITIQIMFVNTLVSKSTSPENYFLTAVVVYMELAFLAQIKTIRFGYTLQLYTFFFL